MLEATIARLAKINKDREHLFSDDALQLARLLLIEAQELEDQINESLVTDEAMPVALEVADVLIYAISLCIALDLNVEEVINLKLDRNERKFPVSIAQMKQNWKAQGSDAAWSHEL